MNREIKFRCWDKDHKKMIYFDGENYYLNIPTIDPDGYKGWVGMEIKETGLSSSFLYSSQDVLMQYTGLKDKNGKDVFEGDVVKTRFGNGLIKWSDRGGSFVWKVVGGETYIVDGFRDASNNNEVEVIGNIHESPELLKN